MKIKISIFILLFLLKILSSLAFAQQEIGVIPYKIANPTDTFTVEDGKEYAKLVSIAAGISKDILILPHERTDAALKKLSLNSQMTITEDDLIAIGKMGKADSILLGTLSGSKGQYTSESILYSLKSRKIISKCSVYSSNLFSLAEEETNEIFFNSPNRKRTITDKQVDAVILADLSYKTSTEWSSIKSAITAFSEKISENWTLNTEISIIPYSEKYLSLNKYSGSRSPQSLNDKLKQLIPSGNVSVNHFQNALNYAIKNNPWRRESEKILIIISNSENIKGKFLEQYAIAAKAKKIAINTISLGLVKDNSLDTLKQFSNISSGIHYSASYHQRTFNEKGNPVDIFYQDERIFQTTVYDDSWKNGLFEDNRRKQSVIQKPRSFLNEIFYDEKKYNINPYNLSQYYPALLQINIINKEQLENNITPIMQKIGENFGSTFTKTPAKKTISKVQISDGEVLLSIQISDDKDLSYLKKKMNANKYFPLGVVVKKSTNDPYGISFYPDLFITGFDDNDVPDLIKTGINKIIKDPDYYMSNGLLTPPVWFVDVKILKLENLKKEYDIRDINK
jgi:hypothetical protein